jgi:hypothetical protein
MTQYLSFAPKNVTAEPKSEDTSTANFGSALGPAIGLVGGVFILIFVFVLIQHFRKKRKEKRAKGKKAKIIQDKKQISDEKLVKKIDAKIQALLKAGHPQPVLFAKIKKYVPLPKKVKTLADALEKLDSLTSIYSGQMRALNIHLGKLLHPPKKKKNKGSTSEEQKKILDYLKKVKKTYRQFSDFIDDSIEGARGNPTPLKVLEFIQTEVHFMVNALGQLKSKGITSKGTTFTEIEKEVKDYNRGRTKDIIRL